MKKLVNLPYGVGVMDGTLIELGIAPSSIDTSDYHEQKMQWSIACLFIDDLKRKVHAYLAGFLGSTHDNQIWRNMTPYFGSTEYIECDSAFDFLPYCIPAYSTNIGFIQSEDKQLFNYTLPRAHVSSEHTIGMGKG